MQNGKFEEKVKAIGKNGGFGENGETGELSSEPRMYADDTHLTCAGTDIYFIQSSLNRDLLNISHWLTANKLTLNMTKTEFMLIGSRQKLNNLPAPPALEINGSHVTQVRSTKSLGIIIEEKLTWVNHIDTI